MTLDGRTVLIIGGTSGIGLEVARQAASRGASLVITGRDPAKLDLAGEHLRALRTEVLDAHDDQALEAFVDRLDGVDHVVSLVGDSMSGGFTTTTPDTMRHVLMSKFWTNWMIGRLSAPKLRDNGTITFTAGTGGRPHEVSASYVANLGLAALVQGLAVELAPRLRVNAVAPTFMDTPFWRNMTRQQFEEGARQFAGVVPLGRLGAVDEVASSYIHLMENGFITGQILSVDGGVMLAT
jgi:NAD(P)-dependent dehydrogenase (short-subunit alcohol dehydrogenase family)